MPDILATLSGVRKAGDGWMARCPAHDDRQASLSVRHGDRQPWVITCHAGCTLEAVLSAAGLTMADVMTPREVSTATTKTTTYTVRDVDGQIVALHERIPDANGGKRFVWRQPDGTPGLGGRRTADLPLYGVERLRELPAGALVVVTEGERACGALLRREIAAVGTVTGASGTPSDDVLRVLAGYRVRLWPDHDDVGRQHMARIAARLRALGCTDLATIHWPEAPEHGDAADYVGDPRALLEAPAASDPAPWLDVEAQWSAMVNEDHEATTGRRVYLGLPQIDETIGGLRRGEVCGLMARPGIGKTLVLSHVTHGIAETDAVGHVFFSLEMPAAQIVARLQQRIYQLGRHGREDAAKAGTLDAVRYRQLFHSLLIVETPGLSVAQMEALLHQIVEGPFKGRALGLVTIDHLGLIGGDRKLATYDRVSVQAREIKELAKRFHTSVLLAVQVNRDAGGDGSRELGLGSARDSGVVEEAMDYLVGLRRLDRSLTLAPREREQYQNVIFAKVIKNRHGDTDTRETAYRFYPVGLRLEEDPRIRAEQNDIARIAASVGGRR